MIGRFIFLHFLAGIILVSIGCQTPEIETPVPPTLQITATEVLDIVTPSPTPPIDDEGNNLVICMSGEPASLFWYSQESVLEEAVLHGIFENDLTTLSYGFQAVGLERVPSFQNGDAFIRIVPVSEGDLVVGASGQVMNLEIGSQIIDSEGNLVLYDGSTLLLNQLVVDYQMKQRTWSDGQPVTAADSVYSFQLASRPDFTGDKYLVDRTASYQSTGNLQVRWSGLPGYQSNDLQSNFFHPLPRHAWLNIDPAELESAEASSRFPLGDGPFQIVEWIPKESIRLEPNPNYYRRNENLPHLDSVTFRFIADTNQRIAQLLAGSCHVVGHGGLDPELIPFLLEAQEAQLLQTSITQDRFGWELIFGVNSWADYGDGIGRPDWFEDVRVRQAVARCINREEIVDSIYYGQTSVADTYIPPNHPLSANSIASWIYDPEAGNGLLTEVGYVDTNGDGIREDPITAVDFHVNLIVGLEPRELAIAQIIENGLADCGIDILIERQTPNEQALTEENKVNGRRFDLALSRTEAAHTPGCKQFTTREITGSPDQINPLTNEPYIGWEGSNFSGWSNFTFDAICASALAVPAGSTQEIQNHQQAQRIFSVDLPVLPLVLEPKITAFNPAVQQISNDPTQNSEFWNLFEVGLNAKNEESRQ